MFYRILADVTAATHITLMAYVVFGQLLILVGIPLGWRWIRNPWFRWIHMAAILTVAAEATLNVTCPLTDWEYDLRLLAGQKPSQQTFTEQVLDRILYPFEGTGVPAWVLPACYFGFAGLVLLSGVIAPPGRSAPQGRLALRLGCAGAGAARNGAAGRRGQTVAEVSVAPSANGTDTYTVVCPVCEQPVGVRIKSRGRFWLQAGALALAGVALTCLGLFLPALETAWGGKIAEDRRLALQAAAAHALALPAVGPVVAQSTAAVGVARQPRREIAPTARHTTVTAIGLLILFLAPSGLLIRRAILRHEPRAEASHASRHRVLV